VITKLDDSFGSAVGYRFTGHIDKSDYEVLIPGIEALVAQYGSVQLLCDLTDFKMEQPSAWGKDLHFGREFHKEITKMAVVGAGELTAILADLARPFYAQSVKHFPDHETAWAWLRS
jgi:hypothetical protein